MSEILRLQLELLDHGLELPSLVEDVDAALVLTMGARSLGWSMAGESSDLPGAPLDLSGGAVTLTARRLATSVPAGCESAWTGDRWPNPRRWLGYSTLFDVTGVLVDAMHGVVSFSLPTATLGAVGRFVASPVATLASGAVVIPRLLFFNIVPRWL